MDEVLCISCQLAIPEGQLVPHMRWHEAQFAHDELAHAHQENLIERMHAAEKQIEALLARVHLLEKRGTYQPSERNPGQFY